MNSTNSGYASTPFHHSSTTSSTGTAGSSVRPQRSTLHHHRTFSSSSNHSNNNNNNTNNNHYLNHPHGNLLSPTNSTLMLNSNNLNSNNNTSSSPIHKGNTNLIVRRSSIVRHKEINDSSTMFTDTSRRPSTSRLPSLSPAKASSSLSNGSTSPLSENSPSPFHASISVNGNSIFNTNAPSSSLISNNHAISNSPTPSQTHKHPKFNRMHSTLGIIQLRNHPSQQQSRNSNSSPVMPPSFGSDSNQMDHQNVKNPLRTTTSTSALLTSNPNHVNHGNDPLIGPRSIMVQSPTSNTPTALNIHPSLLISPDLDSSPFRKPSLCSARKRSTFQAPSIEEEPENNRSRRLSFSNQSQQQQQLEDSYRSATPVPNGDSLRSASPMRLVSSPLVYQSPSIPSNSACPSTNFSTTVTFNSAAERHSPTSKQNQEVKRTTNSSFVEKISNAVETQRQIEALRDYVKLDSFAFGSQNDEYKEYSAVDTKSDELMYGRYVDMYGDQKMLLNVHNMVKEYINTKGSRKNVDDVNAIVMDVLRKFSSRTLKKNKSEATIRTFNLK
ncbi:hypothetical protein C9374_003292 [Naegleria lovaniensis]|uniref:Uncharacterized protein n=1 Tax=Naegleria lovaniensis TaxID=51637 RepID=A0AA88GMM5_NAELO|nr:uncharacterized protein C9374_003292 [Naegleria lovaniensis]KAG2385477.1 hypothetical protein C9374_003292 [Naegleria lovaniensis]